MINNCVCTTDLQKLKVSQIFDNIRYHIKDIFERGGLTDIDVYTKEQPRDSAKKQVRFIFGNLNWESDNEKTANIQQYYARNRAWKLSVTIQAVHFIEADFDPFIQFLGFQQSYESQPNIEYNYFILNTDYSGLYKPVQQVDREPMIVCEILVTSRV